MAGSLKRANAEWPRVLVAALVGAAVGALMGATVYRVGRLEGAWPFVLAGALLGLGAGLLYFSLRPLLAQFRTEDWRVTEIEIDTMGQKWKLANSGAQRRVAWSLFVEATTRIATQQMSDDEGDDGIALKSLYDLFQRIRRSITEMEPSRLLPSEEEGMDTIETYALAMLNQDLRPFLSKWHPSWDSWRAVNAQAPSTAWDQHQAFRAELRALQPKIRARVEGLAKIAGVTETGRFLGPYAS